MQVIEQLHIWWGYSRMHANRTHLTLQALTDLDGSVIDTVTLTKPTDWGSRWHDAHGPPALEQARFFTSLVCVVRIGHQNWPSTLSLDVWLSNCSSLTVGGEAMVVGGG